MSEIDDSKQKIDRVLRATLGEAVFRLVSDKKTESDEFKTLLAYYGREKLASLYVAEKKKRSENQEPSGNTEVRESGELRGREEI